MHRIQSEWKSRVVSCPLKADGVTVSFNVLVPITEDECNFLKLNGPIPLVKMMDIQAMWLGVPTPEVAPPDASLEDGQVVSITGLTGSILHTPGHTEGSVCLYLPQQELLLAGDTLFAGSVGRTDLPGGNTQKLLQSIRDSLLPLPDEVTVIPGHGPKTTIGEERQSNPFIQ